MLSYWEQKSLTTYDNIIIGAGLAGLFTALFLKRKYPTESVLVISKGIISDAASTKNAGFACMGSITELEDDLHTSSVDEVVSLFKKRFRGLQIMKEELGEDNIGYTENGSYELLECADENVLDKISVWNKRLFSIDNQNAFSLGDISNFAFKGFDTIINNELEGAIDTGKMYNILKQKIQKAGVEMMANTRVTSFEKRTQNYAVYLNETVELKTKRLILCTNAFTNDLIGSEIIIPARAQVLITKPIPNLAFKGTYHFDRGYYYFREIDSRVLFGGGRQLDEATETTSAIGKNELILDDLKTKLSENILVDTNYEIAYSWSGIMGKSKTKEPISKKINDNLYLLAGFGGMGVALAPHMAKKLVEII